MMSVTPDPNTIIIISNATAEPDCSVCVTVESEQHCSSSYLKFKDISSLEFTCPQPQDVFNVEINREIGMRLQTRKDI